MFRALSLRLQNQGGKRCDGGKIPLNKDLQVSKQNSSDRKWDRAILLLVRKTDANF